MGTQGLPYVAALRERTIQPDNAMEQHRRLDCEALLLGVETLPLRHVATSNSAIFADGEYAAMRAPKGDLQALRRSANMTEETAMITSPVPSSRW